MIAFGFEGGTAVRAGRARVEKRLHLVLQHALLDSVEELLGFLERQAEMLNACGVLLQGDDVCHRFFMAIIAAHDQLQFDAHGEGSSGSGGGGMMQVILPEFVAYPQHLHALHDLRSLCLNAIIDGTQTGARVGFHLRKPTQERTCERVDRLIGHRGFIPFAHRWPPPLRLPLLAPANFLDVGQRGAAHLEPFFKVRIRGLRQAYPSSAMRRLKIW